MQKSGYTEISDGPAYNGMKALLSVVHMVPIASLNDCHFTPLMLKIYYRMVQLIDAFARPKGLMV